MTETIHVPFQPSRHAKAPIAFVGEAPSDEELERGAPFVGPSGRVFNSVLRIANLDRADYFVGNVFDEQLPENEVANWCAPMAEAKAGGFTDFPPIGSKGFLRPEHRWHLQRLHNELSQAKPVVVVPLGATALWAMTGHTQITQYRGSVMPATYCLPGVKLLPTFHPSHILQQWKFLTTMVGDVMKAASETARPEIVLPRRRLLIEPTLGELIEYRKTLFNANLLSLDIETGWGQITCIGFAPSQEEAICVPFVDTRKPNKSYWEDPEDEVQAWRIVKDLCESPVPKLGQNYGAYDAFWLLDKMGIRTMNMAHDTRLLHHALYAELPKDLGYMGATYSQQGAWKTMRTKYVKRDD